MDLFSFDPNGIGGDPASAAFQVPTILKAKPPAVPGAGDCLIKYDAIAEWSPLVGAGIVDRIILTTIKEDGDQPILHLEEPALPFWNLTHTRDCLEPITCHEKDSGALAA